MAAPNRNQHWVPQFYLRYFATPESKDSDQPQIWAFPIEKGEEILVGTRNVAAKRDLYTFCGSEVDQRLTDLEGFLARYWPKFANDHYPIDDSFKKAMSLFICTSYLRHPKERERHFLEQGTWQRLLKGAPRDVQGRALIESVTINDQKFDVSPAELETLANQSEKEIIAAWGETILTETGELAQHLLRLPWSVLFTEKPAFVTTDHPVVLIHPHKPKPGFCASGTQIYFPISPTRLLVIGKDSFTDGMIYPVKTGGEALLNYSIFRSAYRFVFSAWDPISLLHQVVSVGDYLRAEARAPLIRAAQIAHAGVGRNDPCPCGSRKKFKRCCRKLQWNHDSNRKFY